MNLVVAGVIVGRLYEPPEYVIERKPKLSRDFSPCIDCGALPNRNHRHRKRCKDCYKEFQKSARGRQAQFQHAVPRLTQLIDALPSDMKAVVEGWRSRRTLSGT